VALASQPRRDFSLHRDFHWMCANIRLNWTSTTFLKFSKSSNAPHTQILKCSSFLAIVTSNSTPNYPFIQNLKPLSKPQVLEHLTSDDKARIMYMLSSCFKLFQSQLLRTHYRQRCVCCHGTRENNHTTHAPWHTQTYTHTDTRTHTRTHTHSHVHARVHEETKE